jgi:hypothetical protein
MYGEVAMLIERDLDYDGDGQPCHVLFLDGTEVTCYELDPDRRCAAGAAPSGWNGSTPSPAPPRPQRPT